MSTRADREILAAWNSQREGETVDGCNARVNNPPSNIHEAIQRTFDDPEPGGAGALDPSSEMASVEAAVGSITTTLTQTVRHI